MNRTKGIVWLVTLLLVSVPGEGHVAIHITHQYANLNAQSLIGLPMGSHKTIVDKEGDLRWSEWSLNRRPLDVPFGFSAQLDGELAIQLFWVSASNSKRPFQVISQQLYQNRYPFIITRLEANGLSAQEVAFTAELGGQGLDVVKTTFTNRSAEPLTVEARMSGKRRNLPALADGPTLATRDGYLVALGESDAGNFSSDAQGLALVWRVTIPAHSSRALVLKRPYHFLAKNRALLAGVPASRLLDGALESWQKFWSHGIKIDLPEKEIEDFFYSSLAYVFILTERGPQGDLWTLDGPAGYRQYWGRGEYFQARAMEISGHVSIAGETVQHALRLQTDDGEWDGPPISGWPSWDNTGGEAAAVWDYYLFTRDKDWLKRAYPSLLAAARWIQFHREETELPADAPLGSKPIHRQIPWSCRKEPNPPLKPGEKSYWWGLLPWGYGDSGLPEGHNFPANVMALYAVKCAWQAAAELGYSSDAMWLSHEYAEYRQAILAAIRRSVQLETGEPAYLPAMPTYPEAAISQSFLAVYPTGLFSPDDPLVTGLLIRMEHSELQGLPTNMAWMGPSGVWPGESMNVAETYLRRGDVAKTINLLVAALNHSYTTNVWKEEIRVDQNLPVACANAPHASKIKAQIGTGDMPEAWANANLVNLVRDLLLREKGRALYLLSGIPADWIGVGEHIDVQNAPTTFGNGTVSFRLSYPSAGKMVLELTPPSSLNVIVRFPIGKGHLITSAQANGHPINAVQASTVTLNNVRGATRMEIAFR